MTRYTHAIRRALDWCTAPVTATPREWAYYRLPFIVFLVDAVVSFSLGAVMYATGVELEETTLGISILSLWFVFFLVLISVIEELIFRIVPLTIVMSATNRRFVYLATALATAATFGYVHGGVANIAVQGIGGFLYAVLFIKYAENGERFLAASMVVIAMHTAFNGLIGLILLLSGETTF
jgi:membrane protease YdiL (CAAX protease family)